MSRRQTTAELEAMQAWLATQLQRPEHLPKQPDALAGCADYLADGVRLSPSQQLEIYREQYWLRHTGALLEDFPGVSAILGQAEWERLCESYLERFPPSSWTLRDLGRDLAQHISARPETPNQALCVDMARLEWAYVEVFDAPSAPDLDESKIAGIPQREWEKARVIFNPALRILAARFAVLQFRERLQGAPARNHRSPPAMPTAEEQRLVLYRDHHLQVRYQLLDRHEFNLLSRLAAGTPLGLAGKQASADCDRANVDWTQLVVGWFQTWAKQRWIVDVKVGE